MIMKKIILLALLAIVSVASFAADPYPMMDSYSGRWGYVNPSTGYQVIKARYDQALPFSEQLAAVCSDGKWGFINRTGRTVVKCKYDFAESFYRGYAVVRKDGLWGAVDKKGNEFVPCTHQTREELADLIVILPKKEKK